MVKCGGLRIASRQSGMPRFLREQGQEALLGAFQARFPISFQRDAKTSINNEFTLARHNMGGKRHDRGQTSFLGEEAARKAEQAKAQQRKDDKASYTISFPAKTPLFVRLPNRHDTLQIPPGRLLPAKKGPQGSYPWALIR